MPFFKHEKPVRQSWVPALQFASARLVVSDIAGVGINFRVGDFLEPQSRIERDTIPKPDGLGLLLKDRRIEL